MSDLAVLARPGVLDQYADAAVFVVASCERAKEWLTQCVAHGEIDSIVELKSQAEAIRVYTTTKQLGRDAELAAAEIVRRAERGIGLCIRKSQEAGLMSAKGINHRYADVPNEKIRVSDYFNGGADHHNTLVVTDDVADETFEQVIDEAKAEGNLSRSNVLRKVAARKQEQPDRVARAREMAASGHTSKQIGKALGISSMGNFRARHGIEVPADNVVGSRQSRIDPSKVIEETILMLDGIASGLALIEADIPALDAEKRLEWLNALRQPLAALNRFKKELSR